VVGYGGEFPARFRDRRLLLAGATQARRQGAAGPGRARGSCIEVGDEVVSTTMTTPAASQPPLLIEEGKPDHPARSRGRPSSCEEGKEREGLLPSFLKEGWRPKAAGVVQNQLDLISSSFVLALVLYALSAA